ncbi:MAG: alpha-L-rhamnosidase N-terminal domain-containing protein [Clostridia bacterium]|nr:alpha-L-rhamnosidase N-terminal domain-containing protein [Clostridia bacterium]
MDNFKNCKWIAASKAETGPAPMFRKTFDIEKTVKKATLYACGLGYGLYYINGQSVTDDVLLTPVTRYDLTVLYNSYDVTTLIKAGKNAVGAMLGNGWYCTLYPRWDTYKAP